MKQSQASAVMAWSFLSVTCFELKWNGRAGPPGGDRYGQGLHQRHELPDVSHQLVNPVHSEGLNHHGGHEDRAATAHRVRHCHVGGARQVLQLQEDTGGHRHILHCVYTLPIHCTLRARLGSEATTLRCQSLSHCAFLSRTQNHLRNISQSKISW